jgi:hypothetical protein
MPYVTLQSHWRKDHKYYRLFGHFPLISLSDIVSINKRSLIPEIFSQCDVKHIMMLLIKTIMSVLDISTYNIARFVLTFKTTVIPYIIIMITTFHFKQLIWLFIDTFCFILTNQHFILFYTYQPTFQTERHHWPPITFPLYYTYQPTFHRERHPLTTNHIPCHNILVAPVIVRLREIYNQGFLLLCLPSPYHPDKTLYSMKIIKDFCFKSIHFYWLGNILIKFERAKKLINCKNNIIIFE